MDEYKKQIDRLIRVADPENVMLNGSIEHAAVVVERMFANAKTSVKILTRRFDPAIYADEELVLQVESFATKSGTRVEVLVEDMSPSRLSVHAFARIAKAFPNIEIKHLPKNISDELKFNFSVMDSEGHRFEKDKNRPHAIVSFGDNEFSKEISIYFDHLWKISKSVKYQLSA